MNSQGVKIYWTSPDGFFGEEMAENMVIAIQLKSEFMRQGCTATIEQIEVEE